MDYPNFWRHIRRSNSNAILLAAAIALLPHAGLGQVRELSQQQMRQLVAQNQVLSSQEIMSHAASVASGDVLDIRGFLSQGRMTYRLLIQRGDGAVVEVLVNGQSGKRVMHTTAMGQDVSSTALASQRSIGIARQETSRNTTGKTAANNPSNDNPSAQRHTSSQSGRDNSNSQTSNRSNASSTAKSNNGNGNAADQSNNQSSNATSDGARSNSSNSAASSNSNSSKSSASSRSNNQSENASGNNGSGNGKSNGRSN